MSAPSSTYEIKQVTTSEEIAQCLAVRVQVFCGEVGHPYPNQKEVEKEAEQDSHCVHFICLQKHKSIDGNGQKEDAVVGSVRLFLPTSKLGRLAVLTSHRGLSLGRDLCLAVESYARSHPTQCIARPDEREAETAPSVWCNALGTVAGLYEKLGYVKNGGTNVYRDLVHQSMVLRLSSPPPPPPSA